MGKFDQSLILSFILKFGIQNFAIITPLTYNFNLSTPYIIIGFCPKIDFDFFFGSSSPIL